MGKREEDQGARLIRCGMGVLLGGILALAVCCLFLLGCSVAVSNGLAGEDLGYQFTIVGCVLGGFSGGLLAVKRCGCGLLAGLGAGAVLFLLLLTGALKLRQIEDAADFLTKNMAFFFIPAGVEILENYKPVADKILPLLAVLVLTTVITFAVTAGTVHLCLAVQRRLGGGARA